MFGICECKPLYPSISSDTHVWTSLAQVNLAYVCLLDNCCFTGLNIIYKTGKVEEESEYNNTYMPVYCKLKDCDTYCVSGYNCCNTLITFTTWCQDNICVCPVIFHSMFECLYPLHPSGDLGMWQHSKYEWIIRFVASRHSNARVCTVSDKIVKQPTQSKLRLQYIPCDAYIHSVWHLCA